MAGKRRTRIDSGGRRLVLVGGEQPQMRRASTKSWGKAKEKIFLSVLAETCNVTRACEAAGVGVTSVYRRKKNNAGFRAAWLAAVSVAYQQLELVLLERAFNGTEKPVNVRAGEPRVMREYSNQLGIALLKMHRDTAADAGIRAAARGNRRGAGAADPQTGADGAARRGRRWPDGVSWTPGRTLSNG